jgi:hypothetical protein
MLLHYIQDLPFEGTHKPLLSEQVMLFHYIQEFSTEGTHRPLLDDRFLPDLIFSTTPQKDNLA